MAHWRPLLRASVVLATCGVATAGWLAFRGPASHRRTARPDLVVVVTATTEPGVTGAVTSCGLGDVVHVRARDASTIWIYREGQLVATCPSPACTRSNDELATTFRPLTATRYRIVAIAGDAGLASVGHFDRDVLMARQRGASLAIQLLEVVDPALRP
ncbi:MAG: hypothetical protein R3B06_14945 [Kofleriaceae bacterium]